MNLSPSHRLTLFRFHPAFDVLEDRIVPSRFFTVPGASDQLFPLRFSLHAGTSSPRSEVGVYAVQDGRGRVDGLLPSDPGYVRAAMENSRRLFGPLAGVGAHRRLALAGGTRLGFYLIRGGTRAGWLARNPLNRIGRGPLAFFSPKLANPDRLEHAFFQALGRGVARLGWEDAFGGGDRDFNDRVFTLALGRPRQLPTLPVPTGTTPPNSTPPPNPTPNPKDPGFLLGAPPLDMTVATTVGDATRFLYTGSNPIQTGVAEGTIEERRAAVLRGQVKTRDGGELAGVMVSVLGHPEFGQTVTREEGMFDLAVNGGGLLTVNYAKAGLLPSQRDVDVPWNDYAWLPEVVLIPQDSRVTTIDLMANRPMQVAQGSPVTDDDGTRQATLLFTQGTQASMVLPDGSTQPLTTLHVRATEYTVGESGPAAMPGELPPNVAYTYAVELSVDEAEAAGATEVRFDRPVINYVENFLNFPAGEVVPAGYYDPARGVWVPSDSGIVVAVVGETGGVAEVDTDGDSVADSADTLAALGVTEAERQRLAELYDPGQTLWRVPLTHFSSWDYNWPFGPPEDAVRPTTPLPSTDQPENNPDPECGSIIGVQNQSLGEAVGVAGTPFTLRYQSDRVEGRATARSVKIALSGPTIPASLRRIELIVEIAGQRHIRSFSAQPDLIPDFDWDGKDAYGRRVQGGQSATVRIGYVYGASYQRTERFGYNGGGVIAGSFARQEVTIWRDSSVSVGGREVFVGGWDSQAMGLGGWTLDVHHAYDTTSQTLYLGDGQVRSAAGLNAIIDRAAGTGGLGFSGDGGPATRARLNIPVGLAAAPDGSLFIADAANSRIRRVDPNGVITTLVGAGNPEGQVPHPSPPLPYPDQLAIAQDGSLYVGVPTLTDPSLEILQVLRVDPDGGLTPFAGTGSSGFSGDDGPATQARLSSIRGLAVGPDGSVYLADFINHRVRKVGPDGVITTVAGNGLQGSDGDGGRATQARVNPRSVAVGPDGSLYIGEQTKIRRVSPDGTITTVAGTGQAGFSGDGGPATQARVFDVTGIAVKPDGALIFADGANERVRMIGPDGVIVTVAGNGSLSGGMEGSPSTRVGFSPTSVAIGPAGDFYVSEPFGHRVWRVTPTLPGLAVGDTPIASEDGSEIFIFGNDGRHLRTLNALTAAVRYRFDYDAAGRLAQVTDADGNATRVERDGDGNPRALVAPFGQRTALATDAAGYLSAIANPAGATVRLGYGPGGLLTSLQEPGGQLHRYAYDALGRLTRDEDPAGGFTRLDRTDQDDGFTITVTTAEGQTSTYLVENLPGGAQRRVNTSPAGHRTVTEIGSDGSRTVTGADGTVTRVTLGPDPRFGMQAPLIASATVSTPGGLELTLSEARTATLSDQGNPLSLATLTETVTVNGRTYTSAFDAALATVIRTTPEGRRSVVHLDEKGRGTRVHVPTLEDLELFYDGRGRLETVAQGPRSASQTFDNQGNLATLTNPLSQTVTFTHDAAGRIAEQTFPDGRVIRFGYDANGNIATITPPGRPAHAFEYTPAGRVEGYVPPSAAGVGANRTDYDYDLQGRLVRVVQPDGTEIALGYCDCGRLTSITEPAGKTSFVYDDATGELESVVRPDGETLTYNHDGFLPTGTAWSGPVSGSVSRSFDNDFRVTSESVNGGHTAAFTYDRDGLLNRAGALTLRRDAATGRVNGRTLGVVADSLGFDPSGEVRSYQAAAGTMLFSVEFIRDRLGRIEQKTETVGGVTTPYRYSYDLQGRLVRVTRDGVLESEYAYDANGNPQSLTTAGGTVAATYDPQDRLLVYGTAAYAYKANGELQRKTVAGQMTDYTYDALGNLAAVSLPGGTRIEYVVDGENRRVGKKRDGALVQGWLYGDSLRPVAELDGSGNVVGRFIYAGGDNGPAYLVKSGVAYRVITDHLGSVRLVVNADTGEVVQRIDYDEFGRVTVDTNPGFQPFGFAGGLYDRDTGLVRFGARDYDPATGRWTAKDPIRFGGGQANLYAYVGNDPVNATDPSGLSGIFDYLPDFLRPKDEIDVGPITIDIGSKEFKAGASADLTVNGHTVAEGTAEVAVGITDNRSDDPHVNIRGPLLKARLKCGAAIPALTKLPFVGKYFSSSQDFQTEFFNPTTDIAVVSTIDQHNAALDAALKAGE